MSGKFANGVAFFEALTSTNNEIRSATEKYMNELKVADPALLFNYCFEGVQQPNAGIIQIALFVIKRHFVVEKDEVPPAHKPQLCEFILKIVQTYGTTVLMNIGAEIMCGMAAGNKEYQSFLQQLVQICQSPDAKLRRFGLIAFETMTAGHLDPETVESYASSFLTVFTGLLSDPEIQVRMQAVKTTSTFLVHIDNGDLLMKMGGVLGNLITAMIEALNNNEDEGKSALESLITLTEWQPDIWNKYLSDIIVVDSQIVGATKFKEETRSEAIELVLAIAEGKKTEIRKLAEIKTAFFPAMMQMLAELDNKDSIEAWTRDEEDASSKLDPHSSAVSGISRLSNILGGKATAALTESFIMNSVHSTEWTQRCAGILCIGTIADATKDVMIKDEAMKGLLRYALFLSFVVWFYLT